MRLSSNPLTASEIASFRLANWKRKKKVKERERIRFLLVWLSGVINIEWCFASIARVIQAWFWPYLTSVYLRWLICEFPWGNVSLSCAFLLNSYFMHILWYGNVSYFIVKVTSIAHTILLRMNSAHLIFGYCWYLWWAYIIVISYDNSHF